MDIGAPKRIIEIEPASLPIPDDVEPAASPVTDPAREPAERRSDS